MKKFVIYAAIAVCLALVGAVVYLKFSERRSAQLSPNAQSSLLELGALQRTQQLLEQDQVNDALKIIYQHEHAIGLKTESGKQWLNLLIEAYIRSDNFSKMMLLYEAYPRAFDSHEKASLVAADGYILAGKPRSYHDIRDAWRDRATLVDMWFILDVDVLILEGKQAEALKLLKTTQLEGNKDIDRLLRLAMLTYTNNPKEAWDLLTAAYNLDRRNPNILSFRGKLLEALGQNSVALYEYLAAVQAAPANLLTRDQLAEFYMRHNQPALALSIWIEALTKPVPDFIWIKALFWSRVVLPITFDWRKAAPPTGEDRLFIEYLASLPPGTFWDEKAFEKLPNANKFLVNLQVTFWLRLLDTLKKGNVKEAYHMLNFNSFSQNSLNPELERGLKQIINYRLYGSLQGSMSLSTPAKEKPATPEASMKPSDGESQSGQAFFSQLNALAESASQGKSEQKLSAEIDALLTSQEAFSAAFLAAGWLEAALQLNVLQEFSDNFPEWVAYGYTQALKANRSLNEALSFALKQKGTPALSVLIGELYMADKKPAQALAILEPYSHEQSKTGDRAAWLVSIIYVDQHEYAKAKDSIESHPALAQATLGKEGLARIALLQGNAELADKIYADIQDQSPEALSYLARKAYEEKDLKRAQELSEKLLLMLPDNVVLRENLKKITQDINSQKAFSDDNGRSPARPMR